MRKITNYNSFCRDYLGVSESEVPGFIVRNKNTIDRLIARYGIPLSERMSTAKTKVGVPLMYGTDDYEIMLKCDFGKYGGTEDAKVVESVGILLSILSEQITNPKLRHRLLGQPLLMLRHRVCCRVSNLEHTLNRRNPKQKPQLSSSTHSTHVLKSENSWSRQSRQVFLAAHSLQ